MWTRVFLGVAVSAAVLAAQPAGDGTIGADDPRFDRARAEIQQVMESEKLQSVSVAIAKDGKVIWQQAFGLANVRNPNAATASMKNFVAATPHTPYSLASISKPITATGLMRLVEQKKIDLDRPANDYLPTAKLNGYAGPAGEATVRRLLSHTSGLPLHYQFFYEGEPHREPPMDDTIMRYGILVNPPGKVYQYSNLGYGVLDRIISNVSDRSFADFMRAEVFEPLGMRDTSVHVPPALRDRIAARYTAEGAPIPYYTFDHDGGSAIYASAHDLVRFGMFHLGDNVPGQQQILTEAARTAMRRSETPAGGEQYGLGWFIGEEWSMRRIWHTGSMPGVTTILNLYPDNNLVTVVLLNVNNANARTRIAQALVAPFRPSMPFRMVTAENARRNEVPPPRRPFTPTADQLGEWTGVLKAWDRRLPFTMRVEADGDIKIDIGAIWSLLTGVTWENDRLVGRFLGRIPTPDADRYPHNILLDLRLRDGKLSGQATAQTITQPMHFSLSSYVELSKRPAGSQH